MLRLVKRVETFTYTAAASTPAAKASAAFFPSSEDVLAMMHSEWPVP